MSPDPHHDPPSAGTLTLPAWIATDWMVAILLAARGLAVLVVAGTVLLVVEVATSVLAGAGLSSFSVANVVATPFAWPLGQLGVYADTAVVLTALALFGGGVRWALKTRRTVAPPSPARLLALAVKTAMAAVAALLLIAVLVDVLEISPRGGTGGPATAASNLQPDYVRLVFLSGPVLALASAAAMLHAARMHPGQLLGLSSPARPVIAASWAGLMRVLVVGGIGLVGLFAVGVTLELLTAGSQPFGDRLAGAIHSFVATALLSAIDVAAWFLVASMSFQQVDLLGAPNAWKWAGVAVVAVAFFLGGRTAAAAIRAATKLQAVQATGLVGVMLSLAYVVIAINYTSIGGVGGFATPAILLPLPWTAAAAAGAWVWSNERGLPSGVVVQTADIAPTGHDAAQDGDPPPLPGTEDEDVDTGHPTDSSPWTS